MDVDLLGQQSTLGTNIPGIVFCFFAIIVLIELNDYATQWFYVQS